MTIWGLYLSSCKVSKPRPLLPRAGGGGGWGKPSRNHLNNHIGLHSMSQDSERMSEYFGITQDSGMKPELECSISKSLKPQVPVVALLGPIQPGDLGLTGGCQATHLSAGTQGSLSLDNNSQRPWTRCQRRAVSDAHGCGWAPGVWLGHNHGWGQTRQSSRHQLVCLALHTHEEQTCVSECMCFCKHVWCVEGVGSYVTVYKQDAFV